MPAHQFLPPGRRGHAIFLLLRLPALLFLLAAPVSGAVPETPYRPVNHPYPGAQVTDPFAWLEGGSPEVASWQQAQGREARRILDAIPARRYIESQLRRWAAQPAYSYSQFTSSRSNAFVLATETNTAPARLIFFPLPTLRSNRLDNALILVDPREQDPTGLTSIDWFRISPDEATVAVLLKREGEELHTLHFWDLRTGRKLPDILTANQTSTRRGSAAWSGDGSTVIYTRYGAAPPDASAAAGTDRPLELLSHRLGTNPAVDTREGLREIPRGYEIELKPAPDGKRLLAAVRDPRSTDRAHWLRDREGRWRQVARAQDRVATAEFGRDPAYIEAPRDEGIYLLVREGSPRGRIVRLAAEGPFVPALGDVVLPESKDVVADFKPSASGLFVSELKGGRGTLVFYDRYDADPVKSAIQLPVENPGTVDELDVIAGDQLVYRTQSFVEAPNYLIYDANKERDKAHATVLFDSAPAEFSDIHVERVGVVSGDGTRVPLFILRKKGIKLLGQSPTLLTADGAGGRSQMPGYDVLRRLWLNQLGVVAVAQIRGGGEFGEEWRLGGSGLNRRLAAEDLAACASMLVRSNYTRPHLLALVGTGLGATTAAALIARNPDLVQAAVLRDGAYDLLRADQMPGSWDFLKELGAPLDRTRFAAWQASSPYHRMVEGTRHPAIWIAPSGPTPTFGIAHARKLVARMQRSTTTLSPALLSAPDPAPATLAEKVEQDLRRLTDQTAFLFDQLGVGYSVVERGPWSGGISSTSAVVKARVAEGGLQVRLLYADNPQIQPPRVLGPQQSSAGSYGLLEFHLEGLQPDTTYHYVLEVDGKVDWPTRGQLRSFPQGPASFKIAFASCAKTGSANEVFGVIQRHSPLFFIHMGDFHYLNISANKVQRFREAYDTVLASLPQTLLYRNVPIVYMWDDHDYGGNNSNKQAESHEAARLAYNEYVPHYPLPAGHDEPIYQAFTAGRVRFIITDLRSARDDVKKKDGPDKSLMGKTQKEWFKKELLDANGRYPLICWMSTVPWLGEAGTNYYGFIKGDQFGYFHHSNPANNDLKPEQRKASGEDHWAVFAAERREIADFVSTNRISGLCILHGDSHMLAADDGSNADFSTAGGGPRIPVLCAAPLDQTPSVKGGPYSQGVYKVKAGEGCFGLLEIQDNGDSIRVHYSGRNNQDKEKISLNFQVPSTPQASPAPPAPSRP